MPKQFATPPSFTDLHNHLVPGVDDGAATIAESIDALERVSAEGVGALVLTPHLLLPHLDSDVAVTRELDRHRRAFDTLIDALRERPDLPPVRLGQEIWAPDVPAIRRVVHRRDVGLGGARSLLVEFGFDLHGRHLDVVAEALSAGWSVLIAHPERYRFSADLDFDDVIGAWRAVGARLQVNTGSLTGHYRDSSPDSRERAWQLVADGRADLVASDHHGPRRAGVSLRDGYVALEEAGMREAAVRLLIENPARVTADEPPLALPRAS